MDKDKLRKLPKTDKLIEEKEIVSLINTYGRDKVIIEIRNSLNQIRQDILEDKLDKELTYEEIIKKIGNRLIKKYSSTLKKLVNGTGIIIHTNLGRASLSENAIEKIIEISRGYSNLEYDIELGKRGSRYSHVENLLKSLTGAEDALVVNNNAAAVLLVLNEIANSKEVIISRGELIEIGGSFRIPDVMEMAGVSLKEVGTTNRTHLKDYECAIDSEKTGALIKVHSSNFEIIGYTTAVESEEIAKLGAKYNIPTIEDLGSGALIDLSRFRINEKTVKQVVNSGMDIITFSGDKLLGGPQAGIIVGKKKYIEKIKKNQLLRALRVDKFTLAGLEGTLINYIDEKKAWEDVPVLKMINIDFNTLKKKAEDFLKLITSLTKFNVKIIEVEDYVGGGTLPTYKLDGIGLEISLDNYKINKLEEYFRGYNMPIIGRIKDQKFIIHFRTLKEEDLNVLKQALISF